MVTETTCGKTSRLSRIKPQSIPPQDFIKLSLQADCPLLPAGLSELEPAWPLQTRFCSCEEGRHWVWGCVCFCVCVSACVCVCMHSACLTSWVYVAVYVACVCVCGACVCVCVYTGTLPTSLGRKEGSSLCLVAESQMWGQGWKSRAHR